MKSRLLSTSLLSGLLALSGVPALADFSLPPPQTQGGSGIFDALKLRSSASLANFPTNPLSEQEISNLLWAATGLNREGKGWTTPYGRGMAPYNDIYIAIDLGVLRYNWKTHAVEQVSNKDIRGSIALQPGVQKAPVILIWIANGEALSSLDSTQANNFAYIASGAMTQNVYLAAASMGIGARYIVSIKQDVIRKELGLGEKDIPLNIMPLGKK
ncbi:MAG: SagB/ThcOx family dehydrogenase [Burkholderiaceae bacterium]|jgi:nitroreductase|nr:SagB/ThcOx family dehydrogenase [Burkholderiaceae bacterium]